MFEKAIYVSPTVPKGTARIRCMISISHTQEQLQKVIDVFKEVRDKFKI